MVGAAILAGNGLKDWVAQRLTALYFGVYAVFLFGFLLCHPHLSFETWRTLFQHTGFKAFSAMAIFALCYHAWLGLWTVTTDYIKCTALRMTVQTAVISYLLGLFFWGLLIVWGQ